MIQYNIHGLVDQDGFQKVLNESVHALQEAQNPSQKYIGDIGWWNIDEWANEQKLKEIEVLADEIRKNSDAFVLIGVGGSNNAARSAVKALQTDKAIEIIYAGHTLNAGALYTMLESLEGKEIYIDCIAKNFATLEPGSSFRILRKYLESRYGACANERIMATGTRNSDLEKLCQKHNYTFLEFPENIGGRFSALSNVGLLPMAAAGIDIRSMVEGAKAIRKKLMEEKGIENIAYQYACMRNFMYRNGYLVEMLSSFEPKLHYFNYWWTQLFAESEGKDNRGILPVSGEFSEQLHSIGQFIQDGSSIIFETFLHIQNEAMDVFPEKDFVEDNFDYLNNKGFIEINRAAYEATLGAHSAKFTCGEICVPRLNAYYLGQLFYFFQFACYISCEIMKVNPFDQPGVEAYKERMFKALGK